MIFIRPKSIWSLCIRQCFGYMSGCGRLHRRSIKRYSKALSIYLTSLEFLHILLPKAHFSSHLNLFFSFSLHYITFQCSNRPIPWASSLFHSLAIFTWFISYNISLNAVKRWSELAQSVLDVCPVLSWMGEKIISPSNLPQIKFLCSVNLFMIFKAKILFLIPFSDFLFGLNLNYSYIYNVPPFPS